MMMKSFLAATAGVVALAAALADAAVVPKAITRVQGVDSSGIYLQMTLSMDIFLRPSDAGAIVEFKLDDPAGAGIFGTGSFAVPTDNTTTTASIQANFFWAPPSPLSDNPAGAAAAALVLSKITSNQATAVRFLDTRNAGAEPHTVPVNPNGDTVDLLQLVYYKFDLATVVLKKANATLSLVNPFPALPFRFDSININATATILNVSNVAFWSVAVPDLAAANKSFTVPVATPHRTNSTVLPAFSNLTLAQFLNTISQLVGGKAMPIDVSVRSAVTIGRFQTTLSFKKQVALLQG